MVEVMLWLAATLVMTVAEGVIQRPISYAALGDSYAAGDGAGSSKLLPHWDSLCGRFSKAYPYVLLNNTEIEFAQHWPTFEYKACGGATTKSVVFDQRFLATPKDLISIQIGGNQADFFPVLNECVLQWYPLSTCDKAVARARGLILSASFIRVFDDMVKAVIKCAKTHDTLVLILGYARFFNANTEQCNHVSFSVTDPRNVLSKQLRRSLNALVEMLNDVIKASAEANGATYVDVDAVFENHRFCEAGVEEPRPDWEGTWFFRESPRHRRPLPVNRQLPDSLRDMQHRMDVQAAFGKFADLTKTFHPTVQGHEAIAKAIIEVLKETKRS